MARCRDGTWRKEDEARKSSFCLYKNFICNTTFLYQVRAMTSYLVALFALLLVRGGKALAPNGASWIHPGSPFITTHTTPTRFVSRHRTRLQTDPYGMPSYGRLDEDAFVPVQEDPAKAVNLKDFAKRGKSFLEEMDEKKRAARSKAYEYTAWKPQPKAKSFGYTTSAAEASFQRPPPPPPHHHERETPRPAAARGPRPDDSIHFRRYAAEASFHSPETRASSFDEDRRRSAQSSFGRSPSASFNTQRAANAGFRYGPAPGSFYQGQQQQQQYHYRQQQRGGPVPEDEFREFERHQYIRAPEDWKGPTKAQMKSPQEQEFYFAVQPTVGGSSFGRNMPEFFQQNPFEFFSTRSSTSYRNRPLAPNFY